MADQKVSDLPSLNGADVDPADLLYIVDSSAGTAGSKKITIGQYQLAPVSGGTADGVVYLNASKVETSGSALTFDGTNFATTGTASATKLIPTGGTATGNGMYLPAANTLAWSNNGAETMRLDASGNLGIGTSSPGVKLDVNGAGIVRGFFTATDAIKLSGNTSAPTTTDAFIYRPADNTLAFGTSSTERARIDSSGNLLVGKTTTSIGTSGFTAKSDGMTATNANAEAANFNRESSDGGLVLFRRASTQVGSITVTTTATAYVTSSDYRLKNITGPITNSGAYIDSLNPVEGTWKVDGSTFVGLIAHEVQEASRTSVATGVKDGEEMQGMDYSSPEIIANMLAELKSLRARVAALEAK